MVHPFNLAMNLITGASLCKEDGKLVLISPVSSSWARLGGSCFLGHKKWYPASEGP